MKRFAHTLAGLAIGLGLMWWLFRGTDWGEVGRAIRNANPFWLVMTQVLTLATFYTRILRWRYVVRTAKPVRFRHMFSATQIGFLANFTLPGRVGELVRALLLSRLGRLPVSKCIAMVALDRVNDLIGLLAVILVTVLAYTPTGDVVIPARTLGWEIHFAATTIQTGEILSAVALGLIILILVLLYVTQSFVLRLSDACLGLVSKRLAEWGHHFLEQFAEGLHIFRSAGDMAKSISFSLLTWTLFMLILVSMLAAFDIHYPWYLPFVMQTMLAVAISIPGAPGFVGQFHAPLVITLMMLLPGMDDAKAKAFAIVAHLGAVLPVLVVGIICLMMEQVNLVELTHETAQAESGLEAGGSVSD